METFQQVIQHSCGGKSENNRSVYELFFFAALEKNPAGPADVMSVREKMRRPVRKESSENHLH